MFLKLQTNIRFVSFESQNSNQKGIQYKNGRKIHNLNYI